MSGKEEVSCFECGKKILRSIQENTICDECRMTVIPHGLTTSPPYPRPTYGCGCKSCEGLRARRGSVSPS